jgi:hypothetical protein
VRGKNTVGSLKNTGEVVQQNRANQSTQQNVVAFVNK